MESSILLPCGGTRTGESFVPREESLFEEFEKLGIKPYYSSIDKDYPSYFVDCKLPDGWVIHEVCSENSNVILWYLDSKQTPRIVFGYTELYGKNPDPWVRILTRAEGHQLYLATSYVIKYFKARKENRLKNILKHRAVKGSVRNPYAVFEQRSAYGILSNDHIKRHGPRLWACRGFFPTKDIATEAVNYLREDINLCADSYVAYTEVNAQTIAKFSEEYKLVDFEDRGDWIYFSDRPYGFFYRWPGNAIVLWENDQ